MKKEFKVGLFVVFGLVLMGIAIFLIGQNNHLWDPQVRYKASFVDVAGLKPGAPVRMGGVDVGTVSSVGHSSNATDSHIHVEFSVVKREALRIREDTVAHIVNKGLLGDKMMELSVSEGKAPEMPPGSTLKSEEPADVSKYVARIDSIADKAEKAVSNIEQATRPFGDPRFSDDIKASLSDLRAILDSVVKEDNAIHRLTFDHREADKIGNILTNLQGSTNQMNQALADVRDMTRQVRTGPGIAHAVIYDGELSKNAAGTLAEVHKDLEAVREGNGLAHALIYGDSDQQKLMGNVNAMSDDLRKIVGDMRAGKGTLGGLLVDPSIYEDIKRVVGNVERNDVLRAFVRYTIKADEAKSPSLEPKKNP